MVTLIVIMVFSEVSSAQEQEEKAKGPEAFELGEVIVTEEKPVVNLATTVSEVTAEDIEARGAETVADALQLIPGVKIDAGGKGEQKVRIRGFAQNQVKVLIDGVPAHESFYSTVDLSNIPVDAVEKITVVKGATSVLYGPNTLGGVVNIITKKGGKEPYTDLTTGWGDYSSSRYIFNHGGMTGKFNYWFTYGYRDSDGYRLSDDFNEHGRFGIGTDTNEDGGKRDLSNYIKRTLNFKIGYEPTADSKTYLSFDYHNNERGHPPEVGRYWAFTKWDQWHLNLVNESKLTDIISIRSRAFYVDHEDEITDVSWDAEHQTNPNQKWFEKSHYDDYSVGGEFQTLLDFGPASNVRAGFSYIKDNNKQQDYYDAETTSVWKFGDPAGWQPEEEYENDTWSFGLEDEIQIMEGLSAVVGASYDYWKPRKENYPDPNVEKQDSKDSFNPQAGLVYNAAADTILHGSVGKKTRFPTLWELYSSPDTGGGNPSLDPEETINYELGAEHYFTDTIGVSLTGFYSDVSDLIVRYKDGKNWKVQNVADATLQGIEATFDWQITREWIFGANYTYLNARDEEKNRTLPYNPRHRINVDTRYEFPFGLTAAVQASYTQRQYEYVTVGSTEEARKYSDALLFNGRLSQSLVEYYGVGSELWLELDNIFDQDYDEGRPMPGRNFMAGVTFRY